MLRLYQGDKSIQRGFLIFGTVLLILGIYLARSSATHQPAKSAGPPGMYGFGILLSILGSMLFAVGALAIVEIAN